MEGNGLNSSSDAAGHQESDIRRGHEALERFLHSLRARDSLNLVEEEEVGQEPECQSRNLEETGETHESNETASHADRRRRTDSDLQNDPAEKPMPGVGNWKFKSRWCLRGHHDPDGGTFKTFSPMPSAEAINLFFQLVLNQGFKIAYADVQSK